VSPQVVLVRDFRLGCWPGPQRQGSAGARNRPRRRERRGWRGRSGRHSLRRECRSGCRRFLASKKRLAPISRTRWVTVRTPAVAPGSDPTSLRREAGDPLGTWGQALAALPPGSSRVRSPLLAPGHRSRPA
jgi:hypothetical protein